MQYQTFPDVKGSSDSLAKSSALRLPDLKDKKFLDVGCNEGFFVGYALYYQASRAVGIDLSKQSISKAKKRFPEAELYVQSWSDLPTGEFDVITMLSALHYAEDQESLIHSLMEKLTNDGVLVLEISISHKGKDEWISVERSIDTCLFPTKLKLASVLNRYAWKIVGKSVTQVGDPLQRYVVHVRKLKPYVYLLMGEPGSGKTTLARHLFNRTSIKILSGDAIYKRISDGKCNVSKALYSAIAEDFDTTRINETTRKIIGLNLLDEMINFWIDLAKDEEFVIDSYIPKESHEIVKALFLKRGYFPIPINWNNGEDFVSLGSSIQKSNNYFEHLGKQKSQGGVRALVRRLKLSSSLKASVKANLDSPICGEMLDEYDDNFILSGWLVNVGADVIIEDFYWQSQDEKGSIELNRNRKDVISHLRNTSVVENDVFIDPVCGFKLKLPFVFLNKGIEVGLIVKGKKTPIFLIDITDKDIAKSGGGGVFERVTTQIQRFK
jgi:ubiquinone/menaquinone biosynthesis C-methylase UbiE